MLKSIYLGLSQRLLPCVIALCLAACGEAPPEVRDGAERTREAMDDMVERTGEFGEDAVEGTQDAAKRAADATADAAQQTGSAARRAGDATVDGAQSAGNAAADGARDTGDLAANGAKKAQAYAEQAADTVASTTTDVVDEVSNAARAASEWVSDLEQPILEQRREKCEQENGQWAESVTVSACENGYATVTVDGYTDKQECEGSGLGQDLSWQCVHMTAPVVGAYYFNDGPSTPGYLQRFGELVSDRTHFLRWNDLFWDAAVNHDYCYHHGQVTYGYTQKDCDGQMLDDLLAICRSGLGEKHAWFDADACMQNAQGMYGAVRQFGGDNFDSMNTRVAYPKYEPLFDKLGVAREEDDNARRDRIESLTF